MILIVDDSATNQILMEAILKEEGYETLTAFGAREAFKIIEKQKPTLVVLDLMMPEVNGFDFLKQIKSIEKYSGIPIVVVSAINSNETAEECLTLGAKYFFSKPIEIPLFLKKIKHI